MRIVVASGKGGTGKTTIATSLALAAGPAARLRDCDVEAPNAALFLAPQIQARQEVGLLLPQIDEALCTACGRCAEICEYHALAVIAQKVLLFPELCHGCGSCTLICPEKAISERLEVTGLLEAGTIASGAHFLQGTLQVGRAMAVPVICQLKAWPGLGLPAELEICDAPPGASCPVVETMRGADFLLLVTEPTPFGLHDLKQVVGIARELEIPTGVIINRDGIGDEAVAAYCAEAGLPILMRIPLERRLAEALADGRTLAQAAPEYLPAFRDLLTKICALAEGRPCPN